MVEIWSLPSHSELDPVVALKCFMDRRSSVCGDSNTVPVFIHEDGSNLTRIQFNEDLKSLLQQFPELTSSPLDSWTGHSFRAGLPTILQTLGFHEEDIKMFGRWKSAAYLKYLKDMTLRKQTHSKITSTFGRILQMF